MLPSKHVDLVAFLLSRSDIDRHRDDRVSHHTFSVKQASSASANKECGLVVRLTASDVKIRCIWPRRIVMMGGCNAIGHKVVYRRVAVQSLSHRRVLLR